MITAMTAIDMKPAPLVVLRPTHARALVPPQVTAPTADPVEVVRAVALQIRSGARLTIRLRGLVDLFAVHDMLREEGFERVRTWVGRQPVGPGSEETEAVLDITAVRSGRDS